MSEELTLERLRTLMNFIRNQANLTDSRHPVIGPGSVTLNHEEAMLCAYALDDVVHGIEMKERLREERLRD